MGALQKAAVILDKRTENELDAVQEGKEHEMNEGVIREESIQGEIVGKTQEVEEDATRGEWIQRVKEVVRLEAAAQEEVTAAVVRRGS